MWGGLPAILNVGNPANDLIDIINKNRTAQKLQQLNDNPGLGCMALQYAEECKGSCTKNNTINCQPSEDDFVEIFAPNCGVELPTFGTISGHILGCRSKYMEPSEAFSQVLVHDKKTLSLLRNKTHTEVGVGMVRNHKGPFLWCILFSSDQTNTSTFSLEDRGEGIKQKKGCYSGSSTPCSGGQKKTVLGFVYTLLFQYLYFNLFLTICSFWWRNFFTFLFKKTSQLINFQSSVIPIFHSSSGYLSIYKKSKCLIDWLQHKIFQQIYVALLAITLKSCSQKIFIFTSDFCWQKI